MQIKDNQRIIVCDGAMGTMIQNSGLDTKVCPELWNERAPEVIEGIHRAYMESGADMVETNTFGGSPIKLNDYGLADQAYDLCKKAAENARRAVSGKALVAGSVGPTGALLKPLGTTDFEEVVEAYKIQVRGLIDGGVDLILIETMMEITEVKAAVLATKSVDPAIPVITQMTFTASGTTMMGTTPEIAAIVMESFGADYVGVNCSTGPEELLPVVKRMAAATHLPLSVQPNAGLPEMEDDLVVYRQTPEHMASFVKDFVEAGACLVGGCCGTTPEHIGAISKAASGLSRKDRPEAKRMAICSRNKLVMPGEERIGIAKLCLNEETKALFSKGDVKPLLQHIRKQMKASDKISAICLALEDGWLDTETVEAFMLGLRGPLSLPLLVSAKTGEFLEKILRLAAGNVMITDVDPHNLASILPLARSYGASLALQLQG
ncbi:MAG: homocysteine S-methyltransferase family protein, partial [Eubacteriales bacterium]|nr:homocysteine S-methyltransferase family protein [Eubacteriales bacterium]